MKRLKKYSGLMAIALISFALIFASQSCKKDDDNDDNGGGSTDPSTAFVGKYIFVSSTFNASPASPIIVPPDSLAITINPGDNADQFVGGGLLKDSPCANAIYTSIELRANKELYYVCLDGSGEAQMGVWDYANGVLTLTVNSQGNPVPFEINMINAVSANGTMVGDITNLPLPLNAYYDIGAAIPGVGINMQFANVNVLFQKVDDNYMPDPWMEFIGQYVFTGATFNAAPASPVIMPPDSLAIPFNAGDDAAMFVGGGLFAGSPCADPNMTALDMRTSKELFYICLDGSGDAPLGTWDFDESTGILKLTINLAGSPVPFELLIANAAIANNVLTGDITNLPIPLDAYYEIGAAIPGVGINMQMANVATTFNKLP